MTLNVPFSFQTSEFPDLNTEGPSLENLALERGPHAQRDGDIYSHLHWMALLSWGWA